MAERKQKKAFLKPQDDVACVIRLIGKAGKGNQLIVHIPADSVLADSLDNFHALKREAALEGVDVVVVSTDRHIEELAYSARLSARNLVFGKNERLVVDVIRRAPRAERPVPPPPTLPRRPEKEKRSPRLKLPAVKVQTRLIAIVGVAALVLMGGGALGSRYFPRATVILNLTRTPVAFEKAVTVRTDVATYAVEDGGIVLPGEHFTSVKNVQEQFPATGSEADSGKAKGELSIYNERSSAQVLVATTRFTSAAGLVYRIPERVTVPAASADGTPGKISVEVVADEPGEAYNYIFTAGDKWTIPGFKEYGLTDQYEKIYGMPAGSMTGGVTGAHAVATDADVAAAREEVSKVLQGALKSELRVVDEAGLVSPEGAQTFSLTRFDVDQSVDENNTFAVFAEGELSRIVFREADLQAAVLEALRSPVDYDVTMTEPKFLYETALVGDGVLRFTVKGSFTAVPKLDMESIKRQLAGESQASVKTALASVPGLASAQVSISPSWFKRIPEEIRKIRLTLE